MRKGDKGKKVFGVFVILAIIVSVFGGVVSAEDVSGGLKQSVDDAEIRTAVGNLSSADQNASIGCLSNTRLVVPFFSQKDPQWKDDLMGSSGQRIGQIGCAMTCTAMLLKYYGVSTDPGVLNAWLSTHGGYTSSGDIYWAKPAEYSNGKMQFDSMGGSIVDNDNWGVLNDELSNGYPVIVQVDAYPSTPALDSHWVLVTGREGSQYYINDPWDLSYSNKLLSHYYDSTYDNTFFRWRVYHGSPASTPPSPPTITSPGSSSEPGPDIDTTTPTFQWNSVPSADYYGLYISKYPYGSGNIVFDSEVNYGSIYGSSFTLPSGYLQDGVKYRWNMRAHNSAGWSGYSSRLYFKVNAGSMITDQQKQQAILNMVNSHRGSLAAELILAIIRQEGGEGAFHVDGWNYNTFYRESDGPWAQPTNGDGIMQVTTASGYHENSGPYTHDWAGYDHAINDGCNYLLAHYNTYGTQVQSTLHYNTGPNSLYIYLGKNWGDRNYLSHVAGHLSTFVPNTYALQNQNIVNVLNQGQNILNIYLYNMGIATGQSVGYYGPYQTQLDSELHNIEIGGPVITSSLIIIQSPPYYVGETITGQFTITNKGSSPITFDLLTIGGRDPDDHVADFTLKNDITLNPNEYYNYQGIRDLTKVGNYHFFCAYRTPDGIWFTNIPTEGGATNVLDITVLTQECEGTDTSCGIYPDCENCDEKDGCYVYGNGCEERDYYCKSNEEGCDYTPSNRHTDYYDDWDYYCDGDTVRKHRLLHNYYCDGGTCTDHPSMEDDQLVENCNDHDGWVDTGNTDWVEVNDCQEKEKKEQKYRDYSCSGGACTYSVTGTPRWIDTGTMQNKDDGTICGCTVSNTLKRCYSGVCTNTGICNSNCGADAACDGKVPGDSCGGGTCDSNCKCRWPAVGENIAVFQNGMWALKYGPVNLIPDFPPADKWVFFGGGSGWTPVKGDFNDDGFGDIGLYQDGQWALKYGPVNEIPNFQGADKWVFFGGGSGWMPLVGDFNDDGVDDIALFNGGQFALKYGPVKDIPNWPAADKWVAFGAAGWTPVVGDFNNDGTDDIGEYSNGQWALKYGPVKDIGFWPAADKWVFFGGGSGWTPVVGDVNNDNIDDIALFQNGQWALKYGPVKDIPDWAAADKWVFFATGGWTPLVGDFGSDVA